MGAPSSVQKALFATTGQPLNARMARNNFTAGSANVICPAPPAGYVRFTAVAGEGFVGALNLTGGDVTWEMLRGATAIARRYLQPTGSNFGLVPPQLLTPGNSLQMSFVAGGGGGGMEFTVPYQDIVDDGSYFWSSVLIDDVLTTIIPAAPAGMVHVPVSFGGSACVQMYNFDEAVAVDIDYDIDGAQVDQQDTVDPTQTSSPSLIGNGVAISTLPLRAVASLADAVRLTLVYRRLPLAAA